MGTFLKIGVLSYGGAASVGIMQTEILEKRAWIPREQSLAGLLSVSTAGARACYCLDPLPLVMGGA
jgi:chromate transport protein ChrA